MGGDRTLKQIDHDVYLGIRDGMRTHARLVVAELLRLHGVRVRFRPTINVVSPPTDAHVLFVNVSPAHARRDHQVVYGALEINGWRADPDRRSHTSFVLETLRVWHPATDARMTVVIRIPTPDQAFSEAA